MKTKLLSKEQYESPVNQNRYNPIVGYQEVPQQRVTNNSLIRTWENCYSVSLGNVQSYKRRLKELRKWDKPLVSKNNDPNRKWIEWACKISALEGLILESK